MTASCFLDRIAALIPLARKDGHCYFAVLAPNSLCRAVVKAQAGRQVAEGSKALWPKNVQLLPVQCRRPGGVLFGGLVAGVHIASVCARVQQVRQPGAPGWVHHRPGGGVADTGTCL